MSGLKKIVKAIKKVDPLRGGDKVLEAAGLPTMTGEGDKNILDMGQAAQERAAQEALAAQNEANRIAQEAEARRAANEATLQEMNKNYAADLGAQNAPQVVAGGTAAVMDANSEDARKRRTGSGLASTLGINV